MASDPLGGTPYGDQSKSYANNLYLLGQNQALDTTALPTGQQQVQAGVTNLGQVANYDLGILSGNRGTVLQTEAPEISSMLAGYDQSRKAAAQLAPRGGGRSQFLNEQPYKEAGDVNKLIQQARPQAAKDLTQVATQQATIGQQQEQLAAQDINNSLQFLLGKSEQQLNWAKFDAQQSSALGSAIGGTITQLATMLAAA